MMDDGFVYCRRRTPAGVKIEEVSGGEGCSGAVWRAMAWQVYKENGRDGYREVLHTDNGAPVLYDEECSISATHTAGLLVVATLAETPGADMECFDRHTALGVDAERADRLKVLSVRERYLGAAELELVPADLLPANIMAWTAKEALYKAALTPGLDWRRDIRIIRLPVLQEDLSEHTAVCGEAEVDIPGAGTVAFSLYSYLSEGCIVTLALTSDSATHLYPKK